MYITEQNSKCNDSRKGGYVGLRLIKNFRYFCLLSLVMYNNLSSIVMFLNDDVFFIC